MSSVSVKGSTAHARGRALGLRLRSERVQLGLSLALMALMLTVGFTGSGARTSHTGAVPAPPQPGTASVSQPAVFHVVRPAHADAPAPSASAPGRIVIHNSPRTAVVGQTERFSVLLSGQPHTSLTCILHYPDGHEERIPVRTDGQGYSSYTFRVSPYQARRFRDTGTVGVEDTNGRVLAFTRFAIQSPGLHAPAHGHSNSDARGHQHPAPTDAHQHGAGHAQTTRTSPVNPDPAITGIGLAIDLAIGLAIGLPISVAILAVGLSRPSA